jgi:site-specific recombinase XerD
MWPFHAKSQRAIISKTISALFVGQRGDPLSSRAIQRVVATYAEKAELKGVTPHVLRHTAAHNLVKAGVSLDRVAAILGHERLDTTAIYDSVEK